MTDQPDTTAQASPRPLYYADGDAVLRRPIEKVNADGTNSTSMGFLACTVGGNLNEDAAAEIARALNAYDTVEALAEALEEVTALLRQMPRDPEAVLRVMDKARAVLTAYHTALKEEQ